jgi:succinyl-diaminopimelate desuccinylase
MEELLKKLIAYKTVTGNAEETHELLAYAAQYLEERGMYATWYEQNGFESLVVTTQPGHKTPKILLAAHVDVVAATDDMFTLRKEHGKYIGRGVMDMKVAVAAYMQAVDNLREDLSSLDFAIMLTSDEEIGGKDGVNGVVHLINEGYLPKALVLPDGGQDWQLETISNGYAHFTLEAYGKTAHSSRPWEGDNAAFRLLDALSDIKHYFKDHGPETDTLNIGTVHTEGPVNRIPDQAKAEISIRITEPGGLGLWEKRFAEICTKHRVKLVLRTGWDPNPNPLDNPFVRHYADLTEEITGVVNKGFRSFAGSDARFFAELGIPYANAYPRGNGHHSDQEWIGEETPEQMATIITRYVHDLARMEVSTKAAANTPVAKHIEPAIS